MSNPAIKEREMKFNKLYKDLNIKLIKRTRYSLPCMKEYMNNRENLKKSLLNALPIAFSSYVDIKTMNITSFDVEINKYKLLGLKLNELVNALKQLDIA